MLKIVILRYSLQLVLCCLTFKTHFFFLSPIGIGLFYLVQGFTTRRRYFMGSILLILSFRFPLLYPVSYGFVQCNTYTSVRSLLKSNLKYDLSRIVFGLEVIGYLLRCILKSGTVYLLLYFLVLIDIYNLLTLVRPPGEEREVKEMVESVKYLLTDYVSLSQEYRAIFGSPHHREGLRKHERGDTDFSKEVCNLQHPPKTQRDGEGVSPTLDFDLFTPLILVNIENVYSLYGIGLHLLPFVKIPRLEFLVVFLYVLHLLLLSLLFIPFCRMSFYNNSVYLRMFSMVSMFYLLKVK